MGWKNLEEDLAEELGQVTIQDGLHHQGLHLVAETDKVANAHYQRWYHRQVRYPSKKDELLAKHKQWCKDNPEKVRAYRQEYYQKNKERIKARYRVRTKENPEKARERNRRYEAKLRATNSEKAAAFREKKRQAAARYRESDTYLACRNERNKKRYLAVKADPEKHRKALEAKARYRQRLKERNGKETTGSTRE